MLRRVAAGLTTTFASEFAGGVTLVGALDVNSMASYAQVGTGQKYLILPNS